MCLTQCSEMGDERPLAAAAFSPDGAVLATAAWSGLLKLWALPNCTKLLTIRAHSDRVTGALPALYRPRLARVREAGLISNKRGRPPHIGTVQGLFAPVYQMRLAVFGMMCEAGLFYNNGKALTTLISVKLWALCIKQVRWQLQDEEQLEL